MSRETTRELWGPVYRADLEAPEVLALTHGAFRLWAVLCAYTMVGQTEPIELSLAELVRLCRASDKRTVRRWAKALEEAGLLRRELNELAPGWNAVNGWVLLEPSSASRPAAVKVRKARRTSRRKLRELRTLVGRLELELGELAPPVGEDPEYHRAHARELRAQAEGQPEWVAASFNHQAELAEARARDAEAAQVDAEPPERAAARAKLEERLEAARDALTRAQAAREEELTT